MKQLLKLISLVLVMLCFILSVSASELNATTIEYPDEEITVQFEESTLLSSERMQAIANALVHGTPIPQSYSLCWLTGHNTIMETMTVTHHKVDEYDPRCIIDIYLITTCTKCDYYSEELSSSNYLSCCPED